MEINENRLESSIDENNGILQFYGYLKTIFIHLKCYCDAGNAELEDDEISRLEKSSETGFIYKCSLCNYSTFHSANVTVHEKAHNQGDGKEFKCTLCNYSSNLKFVVIRHMNRDHHNNSAPFETQEYSSTESASPENCLQQVNRYNRLLVCLLFGTEN